MGIAYITVLVCVFFFNSIWTFNFFRWFYSKSYKSPADILRGRIFFGSVPCIAIVWFVYGVSKNMSE